jgi:hypothetical protein
MNKFLKNTALALSLLSISGVAQAASGASVAQLSTENIRHVRDLPPATSSNDPIPPAPSPVVGKSLRLIRQAGIGGTTAYARNGVLELGGNLSFNSAADNLQLSVTPHVGHFVTDNLELSILGTIAYNKINDAHKTNVTVVVEPSVHLPIVDQVFVFAGTGVGVAYNQGLGTGVAVAPRIGFNFMVGRSGILTPAFNVNWSSNSAVETQDGQRLVAVHTQLGASLGYSVMW